MEDVNFYLEKADYDKFPFPSIKNLLAFSHLSQSSHDGLVTFLFSTADADHLHWIFNLKIKEREECPPK